MDPDAVIQTAKLTRNWLGGQASIYLPTLPTTTVGALMACFDDPMIVFYNPFGFIATWRNENSLDVVVTVQQTS
jgi:hypothetical protein